jgi:hypothetical protein
LIQLNQTPIVDQCPVKSGSECEQEIRNITQKPRKGTENENESRNNKRNKPLLKLALSPPSLASRPHQQLGLGGLVKKPFSYLFTFFVRKDKIRAISITKSVQGDFGDRLAISCLSRI